MSNQIEKEILQTFGIDKNRDLLIPDREFFRVDVRSAVEKAKKELEKEGDEFGKLASWRKCEQFPNKAKGFLIQFIRGLKLGMNDLLNVDYQLEVAGLRPMHRYHDKDSGNSIEVSMFFHGGATKTECLNQIGEIYQRELGTGTRVVVLCGANKIDNVKLLNSNAQKKILDILKECAEKNQDVLILASHLGQRSFSIPGLGVVYLCYDKGQEGATRQKLSRALTSDTLDKVGRIVTCSFDPNRDDKIDAEIITTADNIAERRGLSWFDSLKYVLSTTAAYDFTEAGAMKINEDKWIEECVDQRRIHRQIGSMINYTKFDESTIREWANSDQDYSRNDSTDVTESGGVWDQNKPKNKSKSKNSNVLTKEELDIKNAAKRAIATFLENFHYIKDSTAKTSVKEMLDEIRKSKEDQEWLYEYYGISIATIDRSIASGGLSYKHLEIALNA
jgi:hypothetical protein